MDAGDLDFQMPCRYFKSSFARSLSLNSNNNNNNNNGNVALALPKKPQTTIEANKQQQQQQQHQQKEIDMKMAMMMMKETQAEDSKKLMSDSLSCLTPPPPALPARRHTISNNNNNNNLLHFKPAATTTTTNQLPPPSSSSLCSSSSSSSSTSPHPATTPVPPLPMQRNLNLVWPLQDANNIGCSAPNYGQQQQQQQQQHQHQQQQQPPQLNVEAVILQNQVDSLQWQLKQTETNCDMYRAVMEEVARFFDRYQQQQQNYRNILAATENGHQQQISRSKSLHHVQAVGNNSPMQMDGHNQLDIDSAGGGVGGIGGNDSAAYLRARSSTNLMLNKSMLTMNDEHNYESIAPAGSYNAFKDFTWRRSPKKPGGCKARLSSPEAEAEKLNQEAFRLARTIRNLLHTNQQQTDLMQQSRHSLASTSIGSHHYRKMSLHNSTALMMETSISPATTAKTNAAAEMLFLRANNIRDSRLSLRSSTDSSVHSTISSSTASSSSKIETDDETTTTTTTTTNNNKSNTNVINPTTSASTITSSSLSKNTSTAIINKQANVNHHGSSTEDESGFSSISSFHDIGLPLSSTLIATDEKQQRRLSLSSNLSTTNNNNNTESRNSTLKSALNGIGLPPPNSSSSNSSNSSKTIYRSTGSNHYNRFSTLSNEDAAAVLWV